MSFDYVKTKINDLFIYFFLFFFFFFVIPSFSISVILIHFSETFYFLPFVYLINGKTYYKIFGKSISLGIIENYNR